MDFSNVDGNSELFNLIKDYMLNNGNEDIFLNINDNLLELLDVLNTSNLKLDELSSNECDYQERISVI